MYSTTSPAIGLLGNQGEALRPAGKALLLDIPLSKTSDTVCAVPEGHEPHSSGLGQGAVGCRLQYTAPATTGEGQMNVLKRDKQLAVICALVEGSSVRSIERMTGVHRDTILRLMNRVGAGCQRLLDARMKALPCKFIQVDEIWTYVQKKQKRVRPWDSPDAGDQFVFVALDADTKLIPSFLVGRRDAPNADTFIHDLAGRLAKRIQLTTDGFRPYLVAVEAAFGANVDFAQLIKLYQADVANEARYAPPRIKSITPSFISGNPWPERISTSFIERSNLTVRMSVRRLTRLTNAFSKKLPNLRAALALHFAHYNFVRVHSTLRVAPAVAAGLETYTWSLEQLIEAASKIAN